MKDKTYWISIGKSRFDKKWKNKEITWAELLRDRFGKPTMTQETQAEYLRMSKDEQDAIKDIGGFVGGVLQGGKRNAQTVKLRSMLTLDVDNGVPDLWDEIKLTVGYTCAYCYNILHSAANLQSYKILVGINSKAFSAFHEFRYLIGKFRFRGSYRNHCRQSCCQFTRKSRTGHYSQGDLISKNFPGNISQQSAGILFQTFCRPYQSMISIQVGLDTF